MYMLLPVEAKKGHWVADGCEPPHVGSGNWTLVLCSNVLLTTEPSFESLILSALSPCECSCCYSCSHYWEIKDHDQSQHPGCLEIAHNRAKSLKNFFICCIYSLVISFYLLQSSSEWIQFPCLSVHSFLMVCMWMIYCVSWIKREQKPGLGAIYLSSSSWGVGGRGTVIQSQPQSQTVQGYWRHCLKNGQVTELMEFCRECESQRLWRTPGDHGPLN